MKKLRTYSIDSIFVLVLFVVFAITVLFVLMSGAGVYKDTQLVMQQRYEERTALSYITAKINHYDEVAIETIDDTKTIKLTEGNFVTYIYCQDDSIKEMYVEKDQIVDLKDGTSIIDAKALNMEQFGNLIKISCTGTNGTTAFVTLNVETGIGGAENE